MLTEALGVLCCCAHIRQSRSADSCDTSHLVFELCLQLSVTGTPASINISSQNSRDSRPAGSSVLTDIFCLLPEGLQAQWDKGTNIMLCVEAASLSCVLQIRGRSRDILTYLFLLCCFCADLDQSDVSPAASTFSTSWFVYKLNSCGCFLFQMVSMYWFYVGSFISVSVCIIGVERII